MTAVVLIMILYVIINFGMGSLPNSACTCVLVDTVSTFGRNWPYFLRKIILSTNGIIIIVMSTDTTEEELQREVNQTSRFLTY